MRRVGGPSLTTCVGAGGRERYGSCLARLQTPRLAEGYLPILQAGVPGRPGVRYAAGVVRRPPAARALARQLRPASRPTRPRADASGRRSALASSRGVAARRVVRPDETVELDAALVHNGARLDRDRCDAYAAARAVGRGVLAAEPCVGPALHRSRGRGDGRRARARDPGARDDVALQRRQRLRGAVVRGGARRRAGDGRRTATATSRARSCGSRCGGCRRASRTGVPASASSPARSTSG